VNANGPEIPALGFGTWQLYGDECQRTVELALEVGYRHIDTAQMYDNEREVGAALKASRVPREEIFLTTKVQRTRIGKGELQTSVEESLERLDQDYADLILVHWPNPDIPLRETMAALADIRERGLTRHVGVSNFTVRLIEQAVKLSDVPLVNNQVEYHPFLDQSKVLATCRKHGISLTAYCPLARGRVFESKVLAEIAEEKGRTVSQIVTRWLIQQEGVIAIPRTSKPGRVVENFQIDGFELSAAEMARIFQLNEHRQRVVNLAWSPAWD
jgi:diketogulonate reductase-like aldo/keto reductase